MSSVPETVHAEVNPPGPLGLPRALLLAFWFCLLAALAAPAVGRAADDEPARTAPYFQVTSATAPGADAFPLKDTQVDVTIAGVIAEVSVVQTYANEGSETLEAVYVFPGSTRAAVHALTMVIGNRVVRAQIRARGEARRDYEAAKSAGKTATLLEQDRPNLFRMNLANILPGDVVQVELRYSELLLCDEGEYELVFPTVVGPRYTRGPQAPEVMEGVGSAATMARLPAGDVTAATFGLNLRLVTGMPIQTLTCPTHAVEIKRLGSGVAELKLDPSADPADQANRDFVVRYRMAGDAVQTGLMLSRARGAKEGYFLAMVQPPARVEPTAIPPRDYVFVVDVSGSMHGFPIDTAKRLMRGLIGDLQETDTFNLVLFAGSAGVLSPRPVAATPEALAQAIVLLERQRAGGATKLLEGLETAFDLAGEPGTARTIVVVTDGYVDTEPEAFDLVRRRLGDASLFAFGIGPSVNRALIEGLARAGQGEPEIVLSESAAEAAAERFRRRIESPVLTGVRASFDGFSVLDVTPPALPDLFAERPLVVFGKWSGVPEGRIRFKGFRGSGAWETFLDVKYATLLEDSRALELLWARARIAQWEDREALAGREPEAVSAITRLGLAHGLLTRHTSFIAVDEVVRNPDGINRATMQPVPLPKSVSFEDVPGSSVPTTPEPAALGLIAIAAAALAWSLWHRRLTGAGS